MCKQLRSSKPSQGHPVKLFLGMLLVPLYMHVHLWMWTLVQNILHVVVWADMFMHQAHIKLQMSAL